MERLTYDLCSFCGKSRADVEGIIESTRGQPVPARPCGCTLPVVLICSECVALCAEILAAGGGRKARR